MKSIKDSKARRVAYNEGYRAGIKEVADFVLAHREVGFNKYGNVYIKQEEWQSKLKEWGLTR